MLDDCLDGGKTGTARKQDDRLLAVFAQEERAVWPLKPEDLALLHGRFPGAEDVIREQPARQVPDMQLKLAGEMRRIGHRVTATLAVLEDDLDVLPGVEVERLCRRQLQGEQRDVRRRPPHLGHARGQFADLDIAGEPDLPGFDNEI